MPNAPDANEFQAKLSRLETLIQQTERLPDAAAREHARELVQAVLDLHATGLEQLLTHIADAGEPGEAILDACASDEVVSGLLLLHGLHPLTLEDRVEQALAQVQPALETHGALIELLGVEAGVVRLRISGDGDAFPSSTTALRHTIEDALVSFAPDASAVEIEGLEVEANGRIGLPIL